MPVRETIERTTIREIEYSSEEIAAAALSSADPFAINHDCLNPSGHHFIADCSEVVCLHCARIAWR